MPTAELEAASSVVETLTRPASASRLLTGTTGVVSAIAAALVLRDWLEPVWLKSLTVLALSALAMLAIDVGIYRTHANPSTGLAQQPLRPLDPVRVVQKTIGFWATVAVAATAYAALPEYAAPLYDPFKRAALWCLPSLVVLVPVYIAWVDRRQRDPIDAYVQISALLAGHRPADWTMLRQYALGWIVKAFFLPLMFGYVTNGLATLWSRPFIPDTLTFGVIFERSIDLFYLADVLIASIAYSLTFRVIDTHVRTVEPTLGGWVICLICYQPFVRGVGEKYLVHEQDNLYWGDALAPWPWLHVAWGLVILALVFVYAWSTVAFGLRFSNLTNRGIITSGPYRWLKHPAYVCKNLSWWMIGVPFIAGAGWTTALASCLMLAGTNVVYYLRARTEERHLSRDPVYRDYQAFMARHGLAAVLTRALRRLGRLRAARSTA